MDHLNHRHMLGTAYVSRPPLSADDGEAWLRELVSIVGMEILFDSKAVYCEDLGNEGVTGVVGLTTSHASFHSWHLAKRPFLTFDIYSCRDFDSTAVLNHLCKGFGMTECSFVVIDRNNGLNKIVERSRYFPRSFAKRVFASIAAWFSRK